MAGTIQYVLKGGPCAGETGDLSPSIDQSGQIECKGYIYKRDKPAKVVGGREQFTVSSKVPPSGGTFKSARAHGGWADMQRTVNRHMPKALRHSDRLTRDALRSLHRAHKVKR